jgi:hypothetical protein
MRADKTVGPCYEYPFLFHAHIQSSLDLFSITIDRPSQPFLKPDPRSKSEFLFGTGDIQRSSGLAVGPGGVVCNFHLDTRKPGDQFDEIPRIRTPRQTWVAAMEKEGSAQVRIKTARFPI